MQLRELQTKFQAYLLYNKQEIKNSITEDVLLTSEVRLKIYHQAYCIKLQTALANNYPVLKLFLGAQNFTKLCLDYINAYPSSFFSIRYFGDKLADYLSENKSFTGRLFLAELAKFEWAMSLVFDAPNSFNTAVFSDIAKLSTAEWPEMRLQFQPSVYRINLNYNTVKIWEDIISEETVEIESPQQQATRYGLLWRQESNSRYCVLSSAEAWAIDSFINKLNFKEVCEGLSQYIKAREIGPCAASFLKNWLSAKLIAKVIIN